jgi:hypothetical protein
MLRQEIVEELVPLSVVELSPRLSPAGYLIDNTTIVKMMKAGVGVRLQRPAPPEGSSDAVEGARPCDQPSRRTTPPVDCCPSRPIINN